MTDLSKLLTRKQSAEIACIPCWCQDGEWKRVAQARSFDLLRCNGCGSYAISPPPLTSSENDHEFYTNYHQSRPPTQQPAARRGRFWRVAKQAPVLEQPGRSVIDVGCGDGHLCAQLAAEGWQSVTGIDISSTRIRRARRAYPHLTLLDCSLAETGITPGSADLVVLDSVIEHLPDPVQMIGDIRACLRPGGRFVVMTPNMRSGNFRLLGKYWTPELAPSDHVFLFTPQALTRLLRENGFSIEKVGSFHMHPFGMRRFWELLRTRQFKRFIWHVGLECGSLYAALVRAGPMLYAVAHKT